MATRLALPPTLPPIRPRAGYPGDLNDDNTVDEYRMYRTYGTLAPFDACAEWDDSTHDDVVSSDLDTAGGQSGSAVWSLDSKYGYTVRAIHIASDKSGTSWERSMADWMFDEVNEIVEANGG